jgi:hypothetical protein
VEAEAEVTRVALVLVALAVVVMVHKMELPETLGQSIQAVAVVAVVQATLMAAMVVPEL